MADDGRTGAVRHTGFYNVYPSLRASHLVRGDAVHEEIQGKKSAFARPLRRVYPVDSPLLRFPVTLNIHIKYMEESS